VRDTGAVGEDLLKLFLTSVAVPNKVGNLFSWSNGPIETGNLVAILKFSLL
jgi:hypothetical protein